MHGRQLLTISAAALLTVALGAPAASAQARRRDQSRRDQSHSDRDHRGDHHDRDHGDRGRRWDRGDRGRDWHRGRVERSIAPRVWVAPRATVRPRWIAPRAVIVTPRQLRVIRPHSVISFGVFFGSARPYRWVAPPRDIYGTRAAPGLAYGAVSLDFGPVDAACYVDGAYVGRVDEFGGPVHPLTLAVGRHRIDLVAAGYQPLAFYVNVTPGSLIPYQGGLQPLGY